MKPINVFYSYSHKDKVLRGKLEACLTMLKREKIIQEWHDGCIAPGREWEKEIHQHLESAELVLLLISPDFIASDFCYSTEMQLALERHDNGQARVVPIILRPTDWKKARFAKLQCLPTGARPVIKWSTRDEAFLDIAEGIRKVVQELCSSIVLDDDRKIILPNSNVDLLIKNKEYTREVWNAILGYQNDNPSLVYQRQLCVKNYEPGTFTLNEITMATRFIHKKYRFEQWVDLVLRDEISLIKKRYPQLFNKQSEDKVILKAKQLLELVSDTGQLLRQNIWYQEYSDIFRRIVLFILVGDPDYELELYPNMTHERKALILHVLKWLEDNKRPTLKEWLHLSIAAGLLGVNEKSVHAATSEVNIDNAINLKGYGLDDSSLVQRVGEDLWETAKTGCRIDATEVFFHTLNISVGNNFNIAVFSDDYLETIFLLKFYEELLKFFDNVEVDFIPRSIRCGNDACYKDVQDFILNFPGLIWEKRFRIIKNGPKLGTVNLLKLHKEVLDVIEDALLVEARGARNYEMMQGINKEIYFGFMVCREFSESVIGLFAEDNPLIFIRQLPGEKSFNGFRERYNRVEKGKMLALTTVRDNQKKWEGGHLSEIDQWLPEVKDRYETILRFYSKIASSFHSKYGDYLETEVKEFLDNFFGRVVVIGCGSGKEVAYLAGKNCEVYGIDFSLDALNIAHHFHPELCNNFFLEDMYNIDNFQLGKSFDGIVANAVFVHLLEHNDMRLMLNKIKSRLSSNGLCFIRVLDKEGVIEEFDHHLFNETRWFVYYDGDFLEKITKETGFNIIKIDRRQHARYPGIFWISLLIENKK